MRRTRRIITLIIAVFLIAAIIPRSNRAYAAGSPEAIIRALGIMIGDEKGNMNLDKNITRAEFTKMSIVASQYKDQAAGSGRYTLFTDLPSTHWASGYISASVANGLIYGYTDGTFRPSNNITLEEAATIVLRLLGYESSDLSGAYPQAQLDKFYSIGLDAGVSAKRGEIVTRLDCLNMFYNLLTAKTKQGAVYCTSLGVKLDSAGNVDYMTLISEGLKGPFVVTDASALDSLIPFSNIAIVYRDGAVAERAEADEYDILYYNVDLRTIWLYSERVTGTIDAILPSSAAPEQVTIGAKNYSLANSDIAYIFSYAGSYHVDDDVTLLLGMDGVVAGVIPSIAEKLQGPYVFDGESASMKALLPFEISEAVFYRDGKVSAFDKAEKFDVLYYDHSDKTVWLYTSRVTGTIESISPNSVEPAQVTIAGKTYKLANDEIIKAFSYKGEYHTGDDVTLLLGIDNEAAGAVPSDTFDDSTIYVGVVTGTGTGTVTSDGKAIAVNTAIVMCTDGVSRTFNTGSTVLGTGRIVRGELTKTAIEAASVTSGQLSGKINASGGAIGDMAFADDIQILEMNKFGGFGVVEAERLSGVTIETKHVLYYEMNTAGEITHLIISDVTGDSYAYGIVTAVSERSADMSISGSYTVIIGGQKQVITTTNELYSVSNGGAAVMSDNTAHVKKIMNLDKYTITSLTSSDALIGGVSYKLSGDCAYYLLKDNVYYAVERSAVSDTETYKLTAWIDNFALPAGGRVRVIVAVGN